jgi:hypothetical protein
MKHARTRHIAAAALWLGLGGLAHAAPVIRTPRDWHA